MMAEDKLKDPVDANLEEEDSDDDLEKTMDISNLKLSDFKSAMLTEAQTSHPFNGYPDRDVRIGVIKKGKEEREIFCKLSHIVIYKGEVINDPSSRGVTIGFPELRDNQGKLIRPGTDRIGNVVSSFNKRVKNFEDGGRDIDCVFDRELQIAEGVVKTACIVPSPSARAQIIFRYDSMQNRIKANKEFFLADPRQLKLLRILFVNYIVRPKQNQEQAVMKFEAANEGLSTVDLSGIPEV
jgi:hypothetical protein